MNWKQLQKLEVLGAIKHAGFLSSINESEPVKESEKNFDDPRIKKSKKILINWQIDFLSQK